MSKAEKYEVPSGVLGLSGPIARPQPGTLPLRGDLAHIALAGTHLAAHYVIPEIREVAAKGAAMLLQPQDDAELVTALDSGSAIELLDVAGDWAWATIGPDGPSGYVKADSLSSVA